MNYEILRFIWWILVGVLLIGFAIMDGHDMGVGILSPFIGKDNYERRAAINSVAPHWDGNQVWFITAGGAIFAAWPLVYAASFSMLYIAILAVLWTIFLRAPAFEYRSKLTSDRWQHFWDWVLFAGSAIPPILFGVAFGNLFLGVPFHFDNDMRLVSDATPLLGFLGLLSPFSILCGLVSFAMIATHGGVYLSLRTDGVMQKRAKIATSIFAVLTIALFAIGGVYVSHLNGYVATNLDPNAMSNPLFKSVNTVHGAWLHNYSNYPITIIAPVLGFTGIICSWLINTFTKKSGLAFIMSALGIAGIILTAGVSLFPFILPSSSVPASGLTLWDSTSSQHTLLLMLIAAVIFTPIILTYTSWVYKIMRGKLTAAKIKENSSAYY